MKASEWAFDELVAQDEAEKMCIVQEIKLRSMDKLRRIIAPVGGQVPALQQFPFGRLRLVGSLG